MSAAVTVTGFDHLVLRVRDVDRAVAFYRDVLGLPIECLDEYRAGTRPFPSARVGAGTLIDLVPDPTYDPDTAQRVAGFLHLCLRIGDRLDTVLAALRARGVDLVEETPMVRLGATGYGRALYVRDPDGYVVELKEEASA
jgi:catechol 2,3-dioxygenase-like lactoylglutathione lyase family enzyme